MSGPDRVGALVYNALVNRLASVRCEVRLAMRQVKTQLTPHLIHLTYEAALRSFWRKSALSSFLRQAAVPRLPSWLPDESKRNYLARVFEILESTDLASEIGSSSAGKEFEKWFYDLMDFSEITSRRPFKTKGREIDGSITIGDTTYLVECKFTAEQAGAPDVDVFRAKVESKADNTMGVFVSISGFSSVAAKDASGRKTPLLLLDHGHLYRVLGGISSFKDVIERVRRHASQTGESYLTVNRF